MTKKKADVNPNAKKRAPMSEAAKLKKKQSALKNQYLKNQKNKALGHIPIPGTDFPISMLPEGHDISSKTPTSNPRSKPVKKDTLSATPKPSAAAIRSRKARAKKAVDEAPMVVAKGIIDVLLTGVDTHIVENDPQWMKAHLKSIKRELKQNMPKKPIESQYRQGERDDVEYVKISNFNQPLMDIETEETQYGDMHVPDDFYESSDYDNIISGQMSREEILARKTYVEVILKEKGIAPPEKIYPYEVGKSSLHVDPELFDTAAGIDEPFEYATPYEAHGGYAIGSVGAEEWAKAQVEAINRAAPLEDIEEGQEEQELSSGYWKLRTGAQSKIMKTKRIPLPKSTKQLRYEKLTGDMQFEQSATKLFADDEYVGLYNPNTGRIEFAETEEWSPWGVGAAGSMADKYGQYERRLQTAEERAVDDEYQDEYIKGLEEKQRERYEDDYEDTIGMMLATMAEETTTEAEELETINIEGIRDDYISEEDLFIATHATLKDSHGGYFDYRETLEMREKAAKTRTDQQILRTAAHEYIVEGMRTPKHKKLYKLWKDLMPGDVDMVEDFNKMRDSDLDINISVHTGWTGKGTQHKQDTYSMFKSSGGKQRLDDFLYGLISVKGYDRESNTHIRRLPYDYVETGYPGEYNKRGSHRQTGAATKADFAFRKLQKQYNLGKGQYTGINLHIMTRQLPPEHTHPDYIPPPQLEWVQSGAEMIPVYKAVTTGRLSIYGLKDDYMYGNVPIKEWRVGEHDVQHHIHSSYQLDSQSSLSRELEYVKDVIMRERDTRGYYPKLQDEHPWDIDILRKGIESYLTPQQIVMSQITRSQHSKLREGSLIWNSKRHVITDRDTGEVVARKEPNLEDLQSMYNMDPGRLGHHRSHGYDQSIFERAAVRNTIGEDAVEAYYAILKMESAYEKLMTEEEVDYDIYALGYKFIETTRKNSQEDNPTESDMMIFLRRVSAILRINSITESADRRRKWVRLKKYGTPANIKERIAHELIHIPTESDKWDDWRRAQEHGLDLEVSIEAKKIMKEGVVPKSWDMTLVDNDDDPWENYGRPHKERRLHKYEGEDKWFMPDMEEALDVDQPEDLWKTEGITKAYHAEELQELLEEFVLRYSAGANIEAMEKAWEYLNTYRPDRVRELVELEDSDDEYDYDADRHDWEDDKYVVAQPTIMPIHTWKKFAPLRYLGLWLNPGQNLMDLLEELLPGGF
tara:strand:- start:2735 stop:6346 length:3612 start_codon:yes stop_codon:yes gene_type:complete